MVNWVSVLIGIAVLIFMLLDNLTGIGLLDEPILLPTGLGFIIMGLLDNDNKKKKKNKK